MVAILVWPSILLTVSIGTPFDKVTVVAKVRLAMWNDIFFFMPHKSAMSFR
jgi:hypothetical protein